MNSMKDAFLEAAKNNPKLSKLVDDAKKLHQENIQKENDLRKREKELIIKNHIIDNKYNKNLFSWVLNVNYGIICGIAFANNSDELTDYLFNKYSNLNIYNYKITKVDYSETCIEISSYIE